MNRKTCDRLARLLHSADSLRAMRLLQSAGLLGAPPPADPFAPASVAPQEMAEALLRKYAGETPAPVGIWKPQSDGTAWIRDDKAPNADWWPPQKTLSAKKTLLPLRVCLLGESTAAGWFYAPAMTPARCLGDQLRAVRPGVFEVIDLAAVNLQALELAELTAAALALTPDVMVILAGNNWPLRLPLHGAGRLIDAQVTAQALRDGGIQSVMRQAEERSRRMSEYVLDVIGKVTEARGVPVVLVIPEVNLADWRRHRPPAWLAGAGAREWHALYAEVLPLLERGCFEQAAAAAQRMCALDGGSCPTSFDLLGRAQLALGNTGEARQSFRSQVDARSWDNFPSTPSTTSVVQDTMRCRGIAHEFAVVDLPEVFADYLGDELPGRRLFLDYCHLTLEGMKVAMAPVTAAILKITDGPPSGQLDWRYLVRTLPAPEVAPEADAAAKFMSALYNAHYGSDYDVLSGCQGAAGSPTHFWMEQALAASSDIRDSMRAYVATRSQPVSAGRVSAAMRRFQEAISPLERQSLLSEGLDPQLVESILTVCGPSDGIEEFFAHHALSGRELDLLRPHYLWSNVDAHQSGGGFAYEKTLMWRSKWPVSHFCVVCDRPVSIRLQLTLRVPEPAGEIVLEMNGQLVARLAAAKGWTRCTAFAPPVHVRRGFNRLTLRWPPLTADGSAVILDVIDRLELGLAADLHPVFGEIARFRAVAC